MKIGEKKRRNCINKHILISFIICCLLLFIVVYCCVILGGTDPKDLYQISLLIDQLRHDDQQIRINACKNLGNIGNFTL